jgi:hypothetical protein
MYILLYFNGFCFPSFLVNVSWFLCRYRFLFGRFFRMLSLSAGSPCSPRIFHLLKWRTPPRVVLRLSSSLPAFRLFVPFAMRPLRTWLSGSGGRGSTLPNLWPSGAWAGGRGGSPDLIDVSQLVLFGRKTRMMSLAAIQEALQLYKRRT